MDHERYRQVRQTKDTVTGKLLSYRNVVAVGVGYKTKGSVASDELCITMSVTDKIPDSQLPVSETLPLDVDDVQTDVIRSGPIYASAELNRRGEMRPALPGVSIGHYQATAGTLGCLVRRDGELLIMSNNHVLARVNRGEPGDAIFQPGPSDGGTAAHQLGELMTYIPLRLPEPPPPQPTGLAAFIAALIRLFTGKTATPPPDPNPPNQVDVALARPLNPSLVQPTILNIGVPTGVAEPLLGSRVRKSGRTTGLTTGDVLQMDVTADVIYGNQKLRFINQVMTSPLSRPGDSGSVILDESNRVVGLMFSGSDYVTLFNPISLIIAALNIEVVTA